MSYFFFFLILLSQVPKNSWYHGVPLDIIQQQQKSCHLVLIVTNYCLEVFVNTILNPSRHRQSRALISLAFRFWREGIRCLRQSKSLLSIWLFSSFCRIAINKTAASSTKMNQKILHLFTIILCPQKFVYRPEFPICRLFYPHHPRFFKLCTSEITTDRGVLQ